MSVNARPADHPGGDESQYYRPRLGRFRFISVVDHDKGKPWSEWIDIKSVTQWEGGTRINGTNYDSSFMLRCEWEPM